MTRRLEVRDPSRRRRLAAIFEVLGDSEPGREFGLRRLESLADFQASVPLLDPELHGERVTARLGFGSELDPELLTAAGNERESVVGSWSQRLAGARPNRVVMLHAQADDPQIDRIRVQDLQTLAGGSLQMLRIESIDADPAPTLERIHGFHPDTLVVPSLATCSWLEGALRSPLERRFTSLRWIFAEHDLDERVRSRLPVLNAGWFHAAGRIGLPARRSPWWGFLLATNSTLIELLPHGDPELDHRAGSVTDERTVLPEDAALGDRYEIVVSSPLGFLRMRSGLYVRVVGFAPPLSRSGTLDEQALDSLPRLRVVRLPPPPPDVTLEGVTLAGAWLTASVRQAFLPEDPALVSAEIAADPDALHADARASRGGLDPFADTELGASRIGGRRKGPKPRSLVIRLEFQGQADATLPVRISSRVDADLRRRSAAYEWLRARDELWEPRVIVARSGSSRLHRDRRLRALSGPVDSPVVRIG
ncbi:MAG: GH3 auxin-responsive promoter family protein [Myxococcales bacterium]|nr:GH3 auxin-responsive promoter family protein [Myxococcales bacterium]